MKLGTTVKATSARGTVVEGRFAGEDFDVRGGKWMNYQAPAIWPNWAVKRTPTLAMPLAFSWPVLVPSALSGSGAAYLGR